ncbi:hypothetical protein [Methanolacinia petrolearia]|uniref:hypothetical protein n=1 Tax=Methanolacinia petrolearia TaxID=54120 RepID=UPI003BAC9708
MVIAARGIDEYPLGWRDAVCLYMSLMVGDFTTQKPIKIYNFVGTRAMNLKDLIRISKQNLIRQARGLRRSHGRAVRRLP